MRPPSVSIALVIFLPFATSQISSLYHGLASLPQFSEIQGRHPDPSWIQSGNKFQGDIDGVDARILNHMGSTVMLNALKNKQLIWTDGIIPYEMDEAFTQGEVRVIERAFNSYKKRTCIRFKKRVNEEDYLYITKGFGCYSQVGRTGGKQELSLGRGCIFHEIIVHELMHSVGFWHEHSRIDRDDYIRIKWENVLSGMRSQFDVISGALQDTLGEEYDYKSIMHYASNAFSKNGQNTIETTVDGFTDVIGSAVELSDMDVVKINKLYACSGPSSDKTIIPTTTTTQPTTVATKRAKKPTPPSPIIVEATDSSETTTTKPRERIPFDSNELKRNSGSTNKSACADHFLDCPNFKDYCKKISFFFVMKAYCPATCGHCRRQ